jgi:hypothetical protein
VTGDQQGVLVHDDVDVARVDPGQVDRHAQLGRLLGAHDVDAWAEAPARYGEAGPVPELGEQLLELGVRALSVVAGRDGDSVPSGLGPE